MKTLCIFSLGAPLALYSSDASSSPAPAARSSSHPTPASISSPIASTISDYLDKGTNNTLSQTDVTDLHQLGNNLHLDKINEIAFKHKKEIVRCIINDQPIPLEILSVLEKMPEPAKSKIIQEIALDIKNNFTGIFRQVNPFPAFLAAYFRQVTADEIEKACMGKSILPSAILHMKTCGTYWISRDKEADINALIVAFTGYYITVEDALDLNNQPGAAAPKFVIAPTNLFNTNLFDPFYYRQYKNKHISENYMNDKYNENSRKRRSITTFFKNNPQCELVVDMGDSSIARNFILENTFKGDSLSGNGEEMYFVHIPEEIHNIAVVGNKLSSIGKFFCYFYKEFLYYPKRANMTSIIIPNTIASIGYDFGSHCKQLKYLNIPNSVISIGDHFCNNCTNLTTLVIPNSVISIGDEFCYKCTNLTTLVIPNRVKEIGRDFCWDCPNLTTLVIPNSVKEIGRDFCRDCPNLKSVVLPRRLLQQFIRHHRDFTEDTSFLPNSSSSHSSSSSSTSSNADGLVRMIRKTAAPVQ